MPSTQGIPDNEIADGWAKQAASEPDDHGVEWLQHTDKYGRRSMPPTSLVHLRCRASEKKWPEARSWCERRHLNKGYVLRTKGKPDPTPPGRRSGPPHGTTSSSQGMLSRACTSRALITDRTTTAGGATWKTISGLNRRGTICLSTVISGKANRRAVGEVKEATKRANRKWRVGDLPADERCSPAVLDFLRSTYVGRAVPPVEENWDSGDEEEEAVEANEVEVEGVEGRAE